MSIKGITLNERHKKLQTKMFYCMIMIVFTQLRTFVQIQTVHQKLVNLLLRK